MMQCIFALLLSKTFSEVAMQVLVLLAMHSIAQMNAKISKSAHVCAWALFNKSHRNACSINQKAFKKVAVELPK